MKDLLIPVGIDKRGLPKLNADIRRIKSSFRRNFGEIAGIAKQVGAAIITGIGAGLTAVVKAGAKLQTLRVGFRSIMGSAEGAAQMVEKLNQFTASTPFQLEEVSRSARQLIAVGVGVDDVNDRLRMLGDIAAASGNSISDIAAAFAKVQAKGKVELENLNQLAERGIPIFDELRRVTGDANMEFGAGSVTVDQYNQALANMASEGGFANDAMSNLSETVDGKLSTAMDNVMLSMGQFAEKKGILSAVTNIIEDFTSALQDMSMGEEDVQKSRETLYDLTQRNEKAHKGNAAALREEMIALERVLYRQKTVLRGTDAGEGAARVLSSLKTQLDILDEAMAFGTLPDAPTVTPTEQPETLEEFKARFNAAAELRAERERLAEVTRQEVVNEQDLAEAAAGLRDVYGGFSGVLEEVALEEEELFDKDAQERIAETENRLRQLSMVGQNAGAVFGFMSSAVGAAFDNIKDKSQGFHDFLKGVFESLLKRAAALIATFAALMVLTGGSAGALKAVGKGTFGEFFKGGMGIAGFAAGGLVTGPTLGLIGEGPGTSLSNPEVIAPLDKLQSMIGGNGVTVTGRLDGRDILISSERAGIDRNRVRGF